MPQPVSQLIRLLNPHDPEDSIEIANFQKKEGARVIDTYDEQLSELAQIRDPRSVGKTPTELVDKPGEFFVEYPWRNTIVRIVGPEAYRELRTNRNRELLTTSEQEQFGKANIAFAGLNVGNPGAVCIALEGGSTDMKLADFDPLSLTNLNRFRAGLCDLGINKSTLTARQILEIDPYYKLELYEAGLTPDNLSLFLQNPKVDLIVEEMDALPLKIALRKEARSNRIPVIMVTGNAEGVLLDVERFDEDAELPILNNLMKPHVYETIASPSSMHLLPHEKVALARDFMGVEYLDTRLLESFEAFGKTLVGIPQLAESSFLRGAILCYAAKAIILKRPLPSGRYQFAFSDHLVKISP
ncbi:ThiF family adenylyltransferase [Patescibacteria group bacterium]|nr:ThiF family adenylyltransferase [Patescibacteria group bacterium]